MKSTKFAGMAAAVAVLVLGGCCRRFYARKYMKHAPARAAAVLSPTQGSPVSGKVEFIRMEDYTLVKAEVRGFEPNTKYGFHIHEFGDCSASDAMSAGGHFNPKGMMHAGPDAEMRHMGDMGNLAADSNGVAVLELKDKMIKLGGPKSILGRAVIVHAQEDDLKTQPTGNAGARLACGVIGAAK